MQKVLTKQEAREVIEGTSKEPGFFSSDMPVFVKERIDVCVLVWHEENGTDRVYLAWKNRSGIKHKELTRYQGSLLEIDEAFKTRRNIVVNVQRNGLSFGSFWTPLTELDLDDSFS